MILQELTRLKLGWDETIPSTEKELWNAWLQDLPNMAEFQVNRCVSPHDFGQVVECELHHFADASEMAYGAVSYLVSKNAEGDIHSGLILAKSHLAPLKKMTIPRLELTAATLSVKLDAKLKEELDLPIKQSIFWTDSTIVLQYIRNEDKRFNTFVANRVATIRDNSDPDQWHYVNTHANPADDVTRGMGANELKANSRWLTGPVEQKMAGLPADRVAAEKPPFSHVGVDCFGPYMVKQGRSVVKRYGCIFTCLVMRAIHIEILHSLNTDSFLNALQRFISRRGQPEIIRSDNGTNFIGAERELREGLRRWNQEQIHNNLLQQGINWKFNPPTASHMGGCWERQIRTTKKVLNSVVKQQTLNDEGLLTLMCLVESIVNGRPLTVTSDDVKDAEPLTPNHLLLLRSSNALPPDVFQEHDLYTRRRWRQIQYLADVFWRRWVREYLPSLQQRQKWRKETRNLQRDDLVLIMDDQPRNKWLMGRVIETFPGKDKLVRSVKVKHSRGVLVRPVQKLCLLEAAGSEIQ